ncbi:MAG: NDP-sugar synthase [Myxococcaceae bacterium]
MPSRQAEAAMTERVAMIMAGGRSSRMRAGGCSTHKGLRVVGNAPLIEWNVRTLLSFGFRELFVAVNAEESALIEWLNGPGSSIARSLDATLSVLLERESLGTVGAVGTLPQNVNEVLVVNVDNLTRMPLDELARFHRRERAGATIATHRHPLAVPFGMLELDGGRVRAYREKPQLPVAVSSGTYVLGSEALARVKRGERLDVPELVQRLLDEGLPVAAFEHEAPWIDVNDEAALEKAQQLFAANTLSERPR